jgi:hypothetical protein
MGWNTIYDGGSRDDHGGALIYPPGILYISRTRVLFEDALLERLEGSRVMRIIIFTYILIHVTFAPNNQSCHTTV